jgi:hypothetical protein
MTTISGDYLTSAKIRAVSPTRLLPVLVYPVRAMFLYR